MIAYPINVMKTQPAKSIRRGFTLIELLVVIAIIAVLAAAGFAAGNAAIQRARKVSGQAIATSVDSAVTSFYNDNGYLPDVGDRVETDAGNGVELLKILLGEEGGGSDVQNKKGIRYLTVKEGKSGRDGLIYNGNAVRSLKDPWGNPFIVVMDTEYEDKLTFQLGGTSVTLNGKKVAVFSYGADKKGGTADDVKSF